MTAGATAAAPSVLQEGKFRAVGAPTEAALLVLTEKLGVAAAKEQQQITAQRKRDPDAHPCGAVDSYNQRCVRSGHPVCSCLIGWQLSCWLLRFGFCAFHLSHSLQLMPSSVYCQVDDNGNTGIRSESEVDEHHCSAGQQRQEHPSREGESSAGLETGIRTAAAACQEKPVAYQAETHANDGWPVLR